jgi:RNA polymerase sigma factor (sigma-70 family)
MKNIPAAPCANKPLHQILTLTGENIDDIIRLLYEKFWDKSISYASTFLPDEGDCKEIVQELFIHIYLRKPAIRSSLEAYLRVSLRNRIYNFLRNEAVYNKNKGQSAKLKTGVNNVDSYVQGRELQKSIFSLLRDIPTKYSEVYILNKLYGLTLKDTASRLQRPQATVERHLKKCLVLLRSHIVECA